jgi:hypothetical protein
MDRPRDSPGCLKFRVSDSQRGHISKILLFIKDRLIFGEKLHKKLLLNLGQIGHLRVAWSQADAW